MTKESDRYTAAYMEATGSWES